MNTWWRGLAAQGVHTGSQVAGKSTASRKRAEHTDLTRRQQLQTLNPGYRTLFNKHQAASNHRTASVCACERSLLPEYRALEHFNWPYKHNNSVFQNSSSECFVSQTWLWWWIARQSWWWGVSGDEWACMAASPPQTNWGQTTEFHPSQQLGSFHGGVCWSCI